MKAEDSSSDKKGKKKEKDGGDGGESSSPSDQKKDSEDSKDSEGKESESTEEKGEESPKEQSKKKKRQQPDIEGLFAKEKTFEQYRKNRGAGGSNMTYDTCQVHECYNWYGQGKCRFDWECTGQRACSHAHRGPTGFCTGESGCGEFSDPKEAKSDPDGVVTFSISKGLDFETFSRQWGDACAGRKP